MNRYLILILLFLFQITNAQDLPLAYIKYFEADFTKEGINKQFISSNQALTQLRNGIWSAEEKTDSIKAFMPPALLLVDNHVLGDFIADVKLNITAQHTDSLSGLFIVVGLRDSSNYYFIKLGENGAAFYKMYRGQVSLIDSDSSFVLKDKVWQDMRISRDILKRTINIETKGQEVKFSDPNLVMGYLGLGISSYKLAMKSFVIWAPTAINRPASVFR